MAPTDVSSYFALLHQATTVASQRPSPGVLVFTPSWQLVYMSRGAQVLIDVLYEDRPGRSRKGVVPAVILDLCDDLQALLKQCSCVKDWEQVQVQRLVNAISRPILLRGFGLPDSSDRSKARLLVLKARLLVLMEELSLESKRGSDHATDRYHFTHRQQAIVRGLARGLTNKELANELGLSENTVKDYLQVIMRKVHVTTRTGVLARIFGVSEEEVAALPSRNDPPHTGTVLTA